MIGRTDPQREVGAEDRLEEGDQSWVLEDIWIDEGLCKGHADIVAAPTARWVLALGLDIGVADWRPGFLNSLDLVVWDEVCAAGDLQLWN